uniref:Rad60/SUMO-like domain-containing protein n=1 Tax=Nomascus leucogenys TaxID=61853 RepID=A0A2I3HRX3_NOMLE
MANEKPKEGVKSENNDHINLKVAGQDGSVVQFKIKRHTPLSKLMKAYCVPDPHPVCQGWSAVA